MDTVDVKMGDITLKCDPRVAKRFVQRVAPQLDPRFFSPAEFKDTQPVEQAIFTDNL